MWYTDILVSVVYKNYSKIRNYVNKCTIKYIILKNDIDIKNVVYI